MAMKGSVRILVLMVAAALAGPAVSAEVVGRVLMAAGEASALRDGRVVKLTFGSGVEDKDTLQTGPRSNLQVRFADESIMSLREQTQLRVDEFRYSGKEGGDEKALFRLVKGAFRTVTGLIGRRDHARYAVNTPSATIGIRGTMFAAAHCETGQCGDAKDGLYGMVIGQSYGTNQLTLKNEKIETIVQQGQVFYVASAKSDVEFLLEPPRPLIDSLAGAGKADRPTATALGVVEGGGQINFDPRPNFMTASAVQVAQLTTLSPTIQLTQFTSSTGTPSILPTVQSQGTFVNIGGVGIVRGQMLWTTTADMDLHMFTPDNQEVAYFNRTVNFPASAPTATATLDIDNTQGINHPTAVTTFQGQLNAVENIAVTGTVIPAGTYTFSTHNFSGPTTAPTLIVSGDNGATSRLFNVPALTSGARSQNYVVTRTASGTATYSGPQ
ncbi:MAG: FecR domain-containing protein [Burkholderiales bacterium]|nr:FecR domain-containing protein [Burkholderiales bacterium]